MGIKVRLVKSSSSASAQQHATLIGLGLNKLWSERLLVDSPANRGMARAVRHLVECVVVADEPARKARSKPRKIRLRDSARAAAVSGK